MLSEHTVAEAAAAAGIEAPPTFVARTGSTNADLLRMADQGAPAWTVLVAGHQEAGRGRLDRTWEAPPGSSLLVSVLLRPNVEPDAAPLLSLAAAVAMARACEDACGLAVRSKWPNDLMTGRPPRKLGGILVEGKVEGGQLLHAVVGVGVNVMQGRDALPEDVRDTATSVVLEGGRPDPADLLRSFLSAFRTLAADWGRASRAATLDAYRAICDTVGRDVRAARSGGGALEGRATGIGDRGELLVDTGAGATERIGFGEVEHLR